MLLYESDKIVGLSPETNFIFSRNLISLCWGFMCVAIFGWLNNCSKNKIDKQFEHKLMLTHINPPLAASRNSFVFLFQLQILYHQYIFHLIHSITLLKQDLLGFKEIFFEFFILDFQICFFKIFDARK